MQKWFTQVSVEFRQFLWEGFPQLRMGWREEDFHFCTINKYIIRNLLGGTFRCKRGGESSILGLPHEFNTALGHSFVMLYRKINVLHYYSISFIFIEIIFGVYDKLCIRKNVPWHFVIRVIICITKKPNIMDNLIFPYCVCFNSMYISRCPREKK